MAKKIWYSRTLEYFWKKYHKHYAKQGLDSESLYVKMKSDINSIYPIKFRPEENRRETLGTELWYLDYTQALTHLFFVDKSLEAFLGNVKLADLQGIKHFLKTVGIEKTVVITKTRQREDILFYDFAVHIPYEKHGFAFSLGLDQELKLTLVMCHGDRISAIPEDHYHKLVDSTDKIHASNAHAFRLAINLLAYMKCFPDCVTDGVPSNLPDEYDGELLKTIALSGKISEATAQHSDGKRISPHFRKGHFRLLRSDFYKNKKGQLVFVHETMVNGKAKTIYTSSDLGQLEV